MIESAYLLLASTGMAVSLSNDGATTNTKFNEIFIRFRNVLAMTLEMYL